MPGRKYRQGIGRSSRCPLSPTRGAVIRSAVELASDVDGLRLILASTLGDRYRVHAADDGSAVGLWRREAYPLTEDGAQ